MELKVTEVLVIRSTCEQDIVVCQRCVSVSAWAEPGCGNTLMVGLVHAHRACIMGMGL